MKKIVSPLQPGAHCGPTSPAELEQRDTGPGQSHIQTSRVEHSGRYKKTVEYVSLRQLHICLCLIM